MTTVVDNVQPVVQEVERTLFFTDVPCGAMKFCPDETKNSCGSNEDEDVGQSMFRFCGGLERAFCFSDLRDVDEADAEKIKAMSSVDNTQEQKEGPPALNPADTESCSDDSDAGKAKENKGSNVVTATAVEDKKPEMVGPSVITAAVTPVAVPMVVNTSTASKPKAEPVVAPVNALQASKRTNRSGKPTNSFQSAKSLRASKKKEQGGQKKRKSWGIFRKSGSTKANV